MAVLVVLAVILTAMIPYRASAQSAPIVQCQAGAWSGVMPSYACDAVTRGAQRLTFAGTDAQQGRGVIACSNEVRPFMTQVWGDPATQICQQIYISNLQDARMRALQR